MMNERTLLRTVFLALLVIGLCGVSNATTNGPRAAAAEGARFSMQPLMADSAVPAAQTYFILDAQPGQTLTRSVRVTNVGDAAGAVRLFAVDATTGATSGTVYRGETDPRNDVGAWIAIDGTAITLDPGKSQDLPITITVPAAPRPGQHVGAIVAVNTLIKTGVVSGGASVNIKTQTIMPALLNLPGQSVEKLSVSGVTGGGESGRQLLLLGLRNDGTTLVAPTGTLVVTNARGEEMQNLPLKLDKILPEAEIHYPVAMQAKALDAGDYQARITLAYGQSGETRSVMPFTITPAQIEQVFPSTKPQAAGTTQAAAPTLVAPGSRSGNVPASNAPVGNLPGALATAPVAPSLLLIGGIGGGLLLLTLIGGGVLLSRRRRT